MATPSVLRVVEREVRVFSRLWRGFVFSLFLNPVLAIWVPLCALPIGLYAFVTHLAGAKEDTETRCRKCSYILRGITEPRCPECGERI